jgi:hypothetical protein
MNTDNLTIYNDLLIALTVILSCLTSARVALFLSNRWNLDSTWRNWMVLLGMASAAVLSFHISVVTNLVGGPLYGIATIVLCTLGTGVLWGYLVAGTRVIEQILHGLENKMTAKSS